MSKNCPFCPKENESESWGFSPEGWESARQIHIQKHAKVCPTCGQEIKT